MVAKINISALLRKQRLTGDDVGRLLLADRVAKYKVQQTGKGKGLFTLEEQRTMIASLIGNANVRAYNNYKGMEVYIAHHQMLALIHSETASGSIYQLRAYIALARSAEDVKQQWTRDQPLPHFTQRNLLSEMKQRDRSSIEFARGQIISGLRTYWSFRKLFELIGERTGVFDMVLYLNPFNLESRVADLNTMIKNFIVSLDPADGAIAEELFPLIDIDALYPAAEQIEQTRALLKDLAIFRETPDRLISCLMQTDAAYTHTARGTP